MAIDATAGERARRSVARVLTANGIGDPDPRP